MPNAHVEARAAIKARLLKLIVTLSKDYPEWTVLDMCEQLAQSLKSEATRKGRAPSASGG